MLCVGACLLAHILFGDFALPGLACLFLSPNWGSFLVLLFQIDFQFLALSLLLLALLWCECWYAWSCPRGSLHYPHFFLDFFFLLFCFVVFCFLISEITDLILGFIENILMSPLLLKDIFTRYWILNWGFFSFGTWKLLCHFFLAFMVSDEKYAVIHVIFLL